MEKQKDFTVDIEQVKEDLAKVELSLTISKVRIEELQRHKETLEYFLEVIS